MGHPLELGGPSGWQKTPMRTILSRFFLPWLVLAQAAMGEAMLQYFNTSWAEITRKMPELAEAGYSSLWLPPPTKGSGGLSVGYDLWDRFDLGGKDQRNTTRTRYGTEADLLELMKVAHRFGIRVYFDNIMNHNAFDVPGYNAYTPVDVYPGFVPEDFHLRRTEDGFYRKWDNTRDWNDAWQVQNLGLADLIDIATEPGTTNFNHGATEGSTIPKIKFIRHPNNPEYYCYDAGGNYVGFGTGNGLTAAYIQANPNTYSERVEDMLNRAARWQIDRLKADGYRLDAVKHTPADFFGATYGPDKDSSDYGYLGQVQRQFNLSRGFSDSNHRDTVFNTELPRDDAMAFGEHLGQPPAYGSYIDAGMRLVDNDLRSNLNNVLGSPWNGLNGYQYPGSGGFSDSVTVMHAQSHDNDYASRRELQHALYYTRAGLGLIYTDGNFHAETLGESGGAFPRHANTAFLGQWGDSRIPNLLKINRDFARGYQKGREGTGDLITYERIDKRENGGMSDAAGTTMIVAINDNYSNGVGLTGGTSFPSAGGGGSENNPNTADEYLFQYARGYGSQQPFYHYASGLNSVVVPAGSYFVFAPRTPEAPVAFSNAQEDPLTIYQNGVQVGSVTVTRRDGTDGDPAFNPDGLADANTTDFAYQKTIPRVTSATNLRFAVRADGSAENILLRLDGGVDLNGTRPTGNADPLYRDYPPAVSTDVFLGFEQPMFQGRFHAEKFAAKDKTRCQVGSPGAETYSTVMGSGTWSIANGPTNANPPANNDGGNMALFLDHDPEAIVGGTPSGGWPGGTAPHQFSSSNGNISLWAKPNGVGAGFHMFVYYTTDGTNPEGAVGGGTGTTRVVEMQFSHNEGADDWWMSAQVPAPAAGATLKYKIGIAKDGASSVYPSGPDSVTRKNRMTTVFAVDGFNAATKVLAPHNDYGTTSTGLEEGMHLLTARAFLNRLGKASLYNTFTRTFYMDAEKPGGQIIYPSANGQTVGGSEYGFVVRADASTTEAWYRITDGDAANDDATTAVANGNGAWVKASEVTPSLSVSPADPKHGKEFRFNYVNIPATGSATVQVRLREITSSAADNLSDNDGHYTTLTRSVNTAGPDVRMFVAFPPSDGTGIDDNYTLKAYFSKSLADGLTEAQLKARFRVRYGADDTWPANASTLDSAELAIVWNETSDFHALSFKLPNLYDGRPDFLHRVEVSHDRPDPLADLTATRRVKALPSTKPRVTILNPQEYDSDGKAVQIILPDVAGPDTLAYNVRVETDVATTAVNLAFLLGTGTLTPVDADAGTPGIQPQISGSSAFWDFTWAITAEGSYRLQATATSPGGENTDRRNATVIRRQITTANPDDLDDDDDGLADTDEGTVTPLPNGWPTDDTRYKANPETWTNGEIHIHNAYGKSDPLLPDSDGDGLPDGLEVGWRTASADTNTTTDTNGDGRPNFIGDLDPPFYNTLDNYGSVPGVNSASEGGDRAKQLYGSITDPGNPDTDGDGLPDGIEDANANGWTDGDGQSLATNAAASLSRNWPNGKRDAGETWTESSPINPDTDGDALADGYGEDKDFSGTITGDSNGNRTWQSGEAWTETDPLNSDTDGDGLPDGWERRYGLNPLDNGSIAYDGSTPSAANGANGDPDNDGISNQAELQAGSDPTVDNSVVLQPGVEIVIGPVPNAQAITRGSVVNKQEFTDWKANDLVVLDEFEGDGSGNQGGDTYPAYDGHDTSRDITAFYARDGGDPSVGGTGDFYFRVDLQDLKPYAEEGNLDIYVAIDTGNTAVGEYNLPDQVNTGTQMRWEAVVAAYQSNNGAVYVDTNSAANTTSVGEDLTAKGVVRRDQSTPDGFKKAYFDSKLDSVEFSISRKALLDAGWLGDPATLHFQVFTTKDGTQDSPQGAGDIGGRSDIRDTIYDDWIAEDYWRDQGYIALNGELKTWFSYNGPDRGKKAKVMLLAHANDPLEAASEIHKKLNNGNGAGYYRPFDSHDAYSVPLGLHLTPTLASALQWAMVDPAAGKAWLDGPTFNARLTDLVTRGIVEMPSTTFADSPLPYYDQAWVHDNVALSSRILGKIYGTPPSPRVFWVPERVMDATVPAKLAAEGFTHGFIDQFRHVLDRFGRQSALLDDGYRVNRINGVDFFVINDQASNFRFLNTDGGLDVNLRNLLSRKARSGEQHQILTLFSGLSDFTTKANADAYDANVAWLASRPWIQIIGPDQAARGAVDLSVPPDATGDQFAALDRGNVSWPEKKGPLWIDHSAEGNYDHWWFGSAQEESLRDKIFDIRPGVPIARAGDKFFGVQSFGGNGAGLTREAWNAVLPLPNNPLGRLARGTHHAANYLAGWHSEDNSDLRTFSTGAFLYPDTSYDALATFSLQAQSQARFAAVYSAVAAWASSPPNVAQAVTADVDLDGENEAILKNGKVFAVFEAIGGRCTAAWSRDAVNGKVTQIIGNPLSFSASATEEEGNTNQSAGSVAARRTSAFKDWYAVNGSGGTNSYVNSLYTITAAPSGIGWRFTSPDSAITKTITLGDSAADLAASYNLAAGVTKLYVRFGLSPDLEALLTEGQSGLQGTSGSGGYVLTHTNAAGYSSASVLTGSGSAIQATATDDDNAMFDSVSMRNQALTQQVEVESTASSFAVSLALGSITTDGDLDGLPTAWEMANNLNDEDAAGDNGAAGDPDHDGLSNYVEWLVGLNPQADDRSAYPKLTITKVTGGFQLSFPTLGGRGYQLQRSDALQGWIDLGTEFTTAPAAPASVYQYTDTMAHPGGKQFYRMVVRKAP